MFLFTQVKLVTLEMFVTILLFINLVSNVESLNASKSYLAALQGFSNATGLPNGTVSVVEKSTPKSPYLAALQRSASDPGRSRSDPKNGQLQRSSPSLHYGGCRTNYDLDYLQLTLSWAPGFCSTSPKSCLKFTARDFTVHGMWPQVNSTESPNSCCFDNTFNYKDIQDLVPDLNTYWFSYFDHDSKSFWKHEWLKHGTCARDVSLLKGEKRYFSSTIDLMKKLPILDTLKKANIMPSKSKVYIGTEFQSALNQISQGKTVQINCDYEHYQPIPILTGINFCFDTNLKFINCPYTKRKCQSQLYFLE